MAPVLIYLRVATCAPVSLAGQENSVKFVRTSLLKPTSSKQLLVLYSVRPISVNVDSLGTLYTKSRIKMSSKFSWAFLMRRFYLILLI